MLNHFYSTTRVPAPVIANNYTVPVSFKGTVQRQLTGGLSGINRKYMNRHCSDGHSFFNLKGLRSLKSENMFSAA
jgi:hypothetical protein